MQKAFCRQAMMRLYRRLNGAIERLVASPVVWKFKALASIPVACCIAAYVFAALAAQATSATFWQYLATNTLHTRVAKAEGFGGPINALLTDDFLVAKWRSLPDPTETQRWWGLVQEEFFDVSVEVGRDIGEDASGIRKTRTFMFVCSNIVFGVTSANALIGITFGPAFTVLTQLLSLSIATFINGAVIVSLFGMSWDEQLRIAYINYVPGWAYFWVNLVLILQVLLNLTWLLALYQPYARTCTMPIAILIGVVGLYILFTVAIPITGYAFSFCWSFIDRVASPTVSVSAPFDLNVGVALSAPFKAILYVGLSSSVLSVVPFFTHMNELLASLHEEKYSSLM
mmetsp:Transcript_4225/g.7054  ORF Transcript_4225/g.7054 Transcript_4225/m.7054 type:complete len:342 (+) Transcript_4225:114-1139(+)